MDADVIEVKSGVLQTFEGDAHEVKGGVYLSPEAYLTNSAQLERERRLAAETTNLVPVLVVGAAVVGLVAGFWLGRRVDDEA